MTRHAERQGAMVVDSLLQVTATATVLLGTLYPLILSLAGGGAVAVGVPAISFLSLFPWLKVRRRRGVPAFGMWPGK